MSFALGPGITRAGAATLRHGNVYLQRSSRQTGTAAWGERVQEILCNSIPMEEPSWRQLGKLNGTQGDRLLGM